ncbi:ABC transporter substrate-binding protein [Niabella hibiscisoli]|uniref:ABC transporter substrate-binding protein n=1 Tax=Niabella hibiscisoli TaxID=1825928 RepID=UPI001F0F7884|nr:helical backbone metal receptor [Niabella hibiscisoli]MCH5721072.1 helical backbone metal receptor [Niabella hibiscisoli]
MRIVSLVPSITELLHYLGLHDETVGITKFCVHPPHWHQTKQRVGGTKNIQIETIRSLHPTLVIASKEENIKEQVAACSSFSEVLLTDVGNFEDALQMIRSIGALTGKANEADQLISGIEYNFENLNSQEPLTAAYLIWKAPWMTVGADTFIHSMMQKAGFTNVAGQELRYPETTIVQLQAIQPQFIILSSEPYPFKEQDVVTLQKQLPLSTVLLADGEMFSWYGSRMLQAAGYFEALRSSIMH